MKKKTTTVEEKMRNMGRISMTRDILLGICKLNYGNVYIKNHTNTLNCFDENDKSALSLQMACFVFCTRFILGLLVIT